ncbi:MAG: hypothetical protein PHS49_05045 [Candidatus Gracilibacteria bacterium]|nr:hypothetical protein [Candidatus Gracilibacteria bacterium]
MTDRKVPVLVPVSSIEANKFRKSKIMNNPITLGTIVSGAGLFMICSGWYGISINAIWAILAETLIVTGIGNLALDIFLRKNKHELLYLQNHEKLRELNVKNRSDYLIDEFNDLGLYTQVELVNKANQFFENFKDILEDKFFEDTITHAEYLSVAEQITLAILNKLLDISTKYKSVQPIDEDYIQKQIENTQDEDKKEPLQKRLEMKKAQESEVKKMTHEIEIAFTSLVELSVNVANISDTSKKQALENLRDQMSILATKTNLYLPEKGL